MILKKRNISESARLGECAACPNRAVEGAWGSSHQQAEGLPVQEGTACQVIPKVDSHDEKSLDNRAFQTINSVLKVMKYQALWHHFDGTLKAEFGIKIWKPELSSLK